MQKLEEVLRAEEDARHAESDARDRAAAHLREAEIHAKRIVESARDDAARQAALLRDEHLARAAEQAAQIDAASIATLESVSAQAGERIELAARAALEELLS
jgi:vacuolar-type H+-ATPase subunit H